MSAQSATSIPETASYAPADSLAFFSISLDATSQQWAQATALGERLGQSLSPQDLLDQLLGTVTGGISGLDTSSLLSGGDLALVVTNPDLAGILPSIDASTDPSSVIDDVANVDTSAANGVVLVAVVPSPDVVAAAINLFLTTRAAEAGVTLETSTYGDVPIVSLPADPSSGMPGIAAARIDDAVIAATTPHDLETIIDLRQGSGGSLADLDTVSNVLAPLPAERLATGIVNGPALASYSVADPSEAGLLAPALSGVNAVTGFSIAAETEGFKLDLRAASPDGTPVFGSNDNFDPTLIDQMPADTQVFVDGSDFGATGVLDAAVAILSNLFLGTLGGMFVPGDFGEESGTGTPEASPVATPVPTLQESADTAYSTLAFLLGFNLKTDLIGLLDGEYALGVWGLNGTDPSGASAAFISETSDPSTLSSSIGSLIGFLGFGVGETGVTTGTTRIGDSTVNSIDVASLGLPSPLTIGVVNGTLAIGLGEDGGTVAVEGSTDSLADDPGFIAATTGLPADRNALVYVDVASLQSTIDAGLGSSDIAGADGDVELNIDSLAIAGFQDGDMAGAQGMLYIPES